MSEEQKSFTSKPAEKKVFRPALIVSERTLYEYSIFLKHLVVGLADESVPAALVCRPDCDVDSVVSPTVEVIRHPVIDLPLLGPQNRKMLVGRLEKFGPTVLHCFSESKARLTRHLARELDLPYVLTVNSLQKRWRRLPISPRHCAKIMAPAKSIGADFSKSYPGLAGRIIQVNLGTFVEEAGQCSHEPGAFTSMVMTHPLNKANDYENLLNAVKHLDVGDNGRRTRGMAVAQAVAGPRTLMGSDHSPKVDGVALGSRGRPYFHSAPAEQRVRPVFAGGDERRCDGGRLQGRSG
jgi:hypothetical protein